MRESLCFVYTIPHGRGETGTRVWCIPRSLVCALDLAKGASQLASYAHALAEGLGLPMHAVHVCNLPDSPHPVTVTAALETASAALPEMLSRVTKSRATSTPDPVSHVRVGVPRAEILTIAEQCDAELIVMSTRARGRFSRVMFGSTAEAVLKASTRPVLTIPAGQRWHVPRSIVVAHDLLDGAGLQAAARLSPLGGRIRVLHAAGPDPEERANDDGGRAANRRARNDAIALLDRDIRRVFGSPAPRVSAHLVSEAPAIAVQLLVEQVEPDLVVVGRSRRSVLARAFVGMMGIELVRKAAFPVLMVPESNAGRAGSST